MKNPLYPFSSNGGRSLVLTLCFLAFSFGNLSGMHSDFGKNELNLFESFFADFSTQTNDCCAGEKPARINMRYTGESCSATSTTQSSDKWSCSGNPNFDSEVYIIANNNSNPASGDIWFSGIVSLNGEFVIDALFGGQTKLSSNTWVHIYSSQGGTLLQTINFHTSCSQPLASGNQWGSLELLGVEDELHAVVCGSVPPPTFEDCCAGGYVALVYMQYTGENCAATQTTQDASKWSCTGDPGFDSEVYIIANDDLNPSSGDIWFSGTVALDGFFSVSAANAGQNKLSSNTYLHIYSSQGGSLLQTIKFHTSCSQPLITGNQWGSAKLIALVDDNDVTICGTLFQPGEAECFCVSDDAGTLYQFNLTTIATIAQNLGNDNNIEAIELNNDGTILYAAKSNRLGIINQTNGTFAAIGPVFGNGDGSAGSISISDVDGLARNLVTDVMYGSHRRGSSNDLLVQINVLTGQIIQNAFGSGIDYVVISGTGIHNDIDDLAFDPETNMLYATNRNPSTGNTQLITINPNTGAGSVVAPITDDMEGLTFNMDGTLLGCTGTSGPSPNSLFVINKNTGASTFSGSFNNGGDTEAITCLGAFNPPGDCFIAAGSAQVTGGSLSGTEHEIEGLPNGVGAQIWDNGDEVVGQIEGQINAGLTYTIRAKKRTGQSGTATMEVYESTDGTNFTLHPNSSTFSVSSEAWTNIVVTANINTNYIKFGKGMFGTVDYEVDAVYSNDCGPPVCQLPICWEYECEDNVDVEVFGVGAKNSVPVTINIPDPSNIFAVVVEIVYKGSNPGPSVFIQDQNGTNYQANRIAPPGTSSNVWYYRAQLPAGTSQVQYSNANSQSSLQSVVANAFRQGAGTTASSGVFISQSLYNDSYTFSLPVPAASVDRDVTVRVPLSEITNDGRVATVIASSGGVTASQTINGSDPALGTCCLNIVTLTLANVPAAQTSVSITVESLPVGGVSPQSLVLAGLVEVESGGCNRPPVAIDDINNTLVDIPVLGQVLTNDYDLDGDNIAVVSINGTSVPAGGTTINIANGSVTIFPDGSYIYGPDPGFVGIDVFDYEICDDGSPSLCTSATVTIEVIAPFDPNNNPPVANNDATQTEEGTPVTISVVPNDYDPDGDVLSTPSQTSIPSNGTVSQNPDGTFTYTPNPGFSGKDSFTYEICDPAGLCDEATVTIVVTPDNGQANDPPVAVDDVSYTPQNTPVSGDASANDYDPDGDSPLAFTQTSLASNGSVVFNPDGSYVYTPNAGYTGPDQFTYEVCDGISGCDQATVYIVVGPSNDPPVAINDINNTLINTPVDGQVLTNDSDPNGDNISVTEVNGTPVVAGGTTVPTPNGSVTINPDGTYTYNPNAGFIGEDTFDYQICDDGTPGPLCASATVTIDIIDPTDPNNNPPVANDDATQTEENTPVIIPVLANDYDPDGDPLIGPTQTSIPANGSVTINPDGTFTYTPDPGFTGEDSFTYEICDPAGLCDDATVTILVTPDNGQPNDPPVAVDDVSYTPQDTPVAGDASENDYDPDGDSPLAFTQTSSPVNGSVVFNPDGSYVYTPNAGYSGPDQFTYEVCDGISGCDQATVYIVVGPRNDPPEPINDINNTLVDVPVSGQVLTNDSDPNGDNIIVTAVNGAGVPAGGLSIPTLNGSVTINPDGTYTYFPDPGFVGEDEFDYEICDDGVPGPLCASATVNLTVLSPNDPVNNPPIANNDNTETELNTPVTINVIVNDYDPDGDVLTTPMQTSNPAHGSVVQNPDGTFTYTPDPGFTGEDSFTYEICDPFGLCDAAYVTIVVRPDNGQDNDPPVAVDDVYYTPINTPVGGDASLNDYDPDGDSPLAFTQTSSPVNGSVTFNPDGTFTYTPDNNYSGPDQFTYMVCDGISGCDAATVYLVVGPVTNNPPVAINDFNNTLVNTPVSGSVLTNDYDPDGDPITVSGFSLVAGGPYTNSVTIPGQGTLTLDDPVTGDYTFVPAPGYVGTTDPVEYQICDPGPLCATARVIIEIIDGDDPDNKPPVANDDNYVTPFETPVSGQMLPNDFDPDGDPFSITGGANSGSSANGGTWSHMADGSFTYSPPAGFSGLDILYTYEICDGTGCDEAEVTVFVNPPSLGNQPPNAVDDAYVTFVDVSISGQNIRLNDPADPDGDPVSLTEVNGTSMSPFGITVATVNGGTVAIIPDGTFTYIPAPGYSGPDHFVYTVCDGISGCDNATAYITILPVLCIDVQVALWLEGSYEVDLDIMRTELNAGGGRSILPGQVPVSPLGVPTPAGNPYRGAPWFYDGSTAEENYSGPYMNGAGQLVTDWVLISLRSSISKVDEFRQVNGLLYSDGHVEFIEPCVLFSSDPSEVWIVVEHRNHMGIMSDTAVTVQGGTLLYDFRQTNSYRTSTSFGQKQIEPGVYAMYAGDMDQQADFPGYDINGLDNIVWTLLNGNFDEYLPSDLDMNGDSNGADIILWDVNNGISSAVPKN